MRWLFVAVFLALSLIPAHAVWAASKTFTITQVVGNDTTPPTTPTNLTATPVSASQIHLTWGASTDNQVLAGYQVYRDGVQIATTKQTLFDDTGLTASTTYSYYVKAYDSFNNISSSSNAVSTTTFKQPVVATSTPTTTPITKHHGGGQTLIFLDRFHLTVSSTTAQLEWTTSGFAESIVRWGAVSPYDLGYVHDQELRRQHLTTITGLEPGRTYQYEVIAISAAGRTFVLKRGTFTTVGRTALASPLNVSGLVATVVGNDVHLSWQNPPGTAIQKIRVVRSFLFYPTDPTDGAIVYEGVGQTYVDPGVLLHHPRQYYTVFVYDTNGNVSSGSVVLAHRQGTPATPVTIGHPIGTTTSSTSSGSAMQATSSSANTISTTFNDFFIVQNNTVIHPAHDTFRITTQVPILVEVPYAAVPEHLKSIIMTIDGKTSYVMRVSKNTHYYEAFIPGITVGTHSISFAIYDFHTSILKQLSGALLVRALPSSPVPWWAAPVAIWQRAAYWIVGVGVSVIALLVAYLIFRFDIRRR